MTIYDIDSQIADLIDEETGEIKDFEAFEALTMERDQKCENIALWIKNLKALDAGIKAEIENLKGKAEKTEAKIEKLEDYLGQILGYQKFNTAACSVSFRKSEIAVVDIDEALLPDDLMTITEKVTRKPNKLAIKALLKNGEKVYGCHLEEHQNITIK